MSMMKPSLSMMDLSNMARISSETPGIRSVTRTNPSSTMDTSSVLSGGSVKPPQGVRLFPLAVRLMCPGKKRDTSFAVLKRLCAKMPPGLIVFDRGFNRLHKHTDQHSIGNKYR